jgi:hypothetical protein
MELEIIEIVREFRVIINNETLGIPIKARILKHINLDGYWYETSSAYKEQGRTDFYRPGAGALSLQSAQDKLVTYLEDFQKAISAGGDYQPNTYID